METTQNTEAMPMTVRMGRPPLRSAQPVDRKSGPNRLLDTAMARLGLRNDAALARQLEVTNTLVSKIRNHRLPVSADVLLRIHEETDLSIRDLKQLLQG